MSKEEKKTHLRRGMLALLAVALLLLSGCTREGNPAGPAPAPSETASAQTPPEEPEQAPAPDPMADGKLRFITDYDRNRSTVFHGGQLVYTGPGIALAVEGGGDDYFVIQDNAGEDTYTFTLCDSGGRVMLPDMGSYPAGIYGNWLLVSGSGEEEGSRVYDLRTMALSDQQLGQFTSVCRTGDRLAVNCADGLYLYALSDLSLIESIPGGYGTLLKDWGLSGLPEDLQGLLAISRADTGSMEIYDPETGRRFENVDNPLIDGLLSVRHGDTYDLYDLETGEVVASDWRAFLYYSDAVKIYRAGTSFLISAPAYENTEEVQYAYRCSGAPYICVQKVDQSVDLLGLDGALLLSVKPGEDEMILDAGDGLLVRYQAGGGNGCTAYWPDGREEFFPQYQNILNFYGQEGYLLGSYQVGRTYLYDLLDGEGNLLLEGLKNFSACDSDRFFYAERGFQHGYLTFSGEWLWSESIFQSTGDDPAGY